MHLMPKQQMLICFFVLRGKFLINTSWNAFCSWDNTGMVRHIFRYIFLYFLTYITCLPWMGGVGQHGLMCILYPRWHGKSLVLLVIGRVCSTQVEIHFCSRWHGSSSTQVDIHFVFFLEWYGQHMLRCILWACLFKRGLVNTSWDKFCFLTGKLRWIMCSS